MDIKNEIMRRARIAAELFDWTPERMAGFQEELGRQTSITNRVLDPIYPEDFGFDAEQMFSPGPEANMSHALRIAIGCYDAACAFRSWDVVAAERPDPASILSLACMFVDRVEMDHVDPDAINWYGDYPLETLDGHYQEEGGAAAWLLAEHRASIEDGRSGYAEMVLEKLHTPCVYVQNEGAGPEIPNGWHRTAGAIITGARTIQTVLVPLVAKEPAEDLSL